eukprot:COSAG05_NODE_1099_length_5888_cov_9.758335_3_plen_160_part_00
MGHLCVILICTPPPRYANTDWPEQHRHLLDDMDVVKFTIDPAAQRLLHTLQVGLVDEPYNAFGKTAESWDGYTLMFRNGWPSRDNRKPVTDLFQQYCEDVYRPLVFALLFGRAGWAAIADHWATFKSCTIKVPPRFPKDTSLAVAVSHERHIAVYVLYR